jgi:S-formylglutathione hydrolase FrmB
MRRGRWFIGLVVLALIACEAHTGIFCKRCELERVNQRLSGTLLDFTHNHGGDRRIWSNALCQKRDLYVYLPPGYDPKQTYPMAIFLHGATQDEQFFLRSVVEQFDQAIAQGKWPPTIIVAPDGSMCGEPCLLKPATFFANTLAGNFEDWVMKDVWTFVHENYSIRKGRASHVLVGTSMGGAAAFAHAIKHKDKVKTAIGVVPALNFRWVDCHGRYMGKFDPDCWGWRTEYRPNEVIGRPHPLVCFRFKSFFDPLIGRGPDAMERLSQFNPIEMLDQYQLKDGELDLFVAYAGRDEFNIDSQVESFLHRAKERGIQVGVAYDPCGHHDVPTGLRLMPEVHKWAAPRIAALNAPSNGILPAVSGDSTPAKK